ncbi:MAG: outer membrane protein assembly factor BamA, partial [Thermoanaerobaculia bacterium]
MVSARTGMLLLALALAVAGHALLAQEPAISYYGSEVASVGFQADTQIDTDKLGPIVLVQEGEPLDPLEVDRSIHALYATGQFRDIRVDAARLDDGRVAVTFLVFVNYKIETVAIDGLAKEQDNVRGQVVVQVGDVLSLSAVDRSATAMQLSLSRRGFVEAVVDPATDFRRDTRGASVTFFVTMGPRASVGKVRFEGLLAPFSEAGILELFGRRSGEIYSSRRARDWGEELRQRLVKQGHRAAEVRVAEEVYSAEARAMDLTYDVNVGPVVVVKLEGDNRRALRRMLPSGNRSAYAADDVDRAVDEMLEYYQQKGYYQAEIEIAEERTKDKLNITFIAKPGAKFIIEKVSFLGNDGVPDDQIAKVVETNRPSLLQRAAALFLRQGVGVTRTTLEDDRDAIEAFYRSQGFLDVKTETARVVELGDGKLEVIFPIVEGPKTTNRTVAIEGNYAIDGSRLPSLRSKAGEATNPRNIALDMVSLQSAYDAAGYPESRVEPDATYSEDRSEADLVFRVFEGARFRIGEVSVVGNTYTDDRVVRIRTSRLLKRGLPLSVATLNQAQRELSKLAIFGRISITPMPAAGTSPDRNIEIRVEEGRAVRLTGSVGYSIDDDFRISGTLSHRNLFGSGRYLGLEAIYSEPRQKVVLTFQEPFTFNLDLPTQVSVFQDDELKDEKVLLEKSGMFIELSKLLRSDLRVSFRYDYRLVDYTCVDSLDERECEDQIIIIGQEEKEDTIASVTQTVFWDRRNDVLDPRRGFLVLGSVEYAFPVFSAEPQFLKGYLQGNWYQPIGKATLALSARVGAIEPRSNLDDPINPVPYSERFFGGGENSHRGFRLDELGILGEYGLDGEPDPPGATIFDDPNSQLAFTPQGGNAMLIGNIELRYPLTESLGVAGFVDVGQVWRLVSTVDMDYLRYAVGAGIFYRTPVGPIRFDLAYNIDAE